jgi:hypothetical protein
VAAVLGAGCALDLAQAAQQRHGGRGADTSGRCEVGSDWCPAVEGGGVHRSGAPAWGEIEEASVAAGRARVCGRRGRLPQA